MKVNLYNLKEVSLDQMQYAVIMARYEGEWIFVQQKGRNTWEIPGGRVEADESVFDCAARELMEESGAVKFALFPILVYGVEHDGGEESFGMLFFADVHEMGPLPTEFEMAKQQLTIELPKKLTYPEIQPELYYRTLEFIKFKGI